MAYEADVPTTLLAIRAQLHLTQEQLAERLGVSFATVNRWEGGNTRPQRAALTAIEALAAEAGVDGANDPAGEAAPIPRRRRRTSSYGNSTTKPMEQMLWDAACSIRGEKDAPKFKDYLLPLLFLKRLSDVFDDEIDRLAEDYGDRDVALEIAEADHALLRFYLPPEARWGVISGRRDVRLAARRPGALDRTQGHRRAPDQSGARRRPAQPGAVRRHRRRRLRCRAQRRARHQPGQAARRRRDLLRPALPPRALPTCSRTSSAAPTSTCCGSSPRARVRAPASSSRRPRSAS